MAINKVVNKSTKSHGAMRNVLEYVLREQKIREGYVIINGPYDGETINYDEVYQSWLQEKRLWDKDSGRMYAHYILSFPPEESNNIEQIKEICQQYADRFFGDFQYVLSLHFEKQHLHGHLVVNSVSYLDGHKLHQTKHDLEFQKEFTNQLCLEYGLSVAEKGHHFDGSLIEEGEIMAWNKDKYNLLINDTKQSFVADCALALKEVIPQSTSREEFISGMEKRGWSVQWKDNRKHIVFQNEKGEKVRDSTIEKTFAGMNVSKEALAYEFKRQNELRLTTDEYTRYYAEVESAIAGVGNAEAVRYDQAAISGDSNTFVRKLGAQERASEEKRDHHFSERAARDSEQRRLDLERERTLRTEQPGITAEAEESQKRDIGFHFSL